MEITKVKKYSREIDTYTTLPATIQTSGANIENYQVYGNTEIVENVSVGVGEEVVIITSQTTIEDATARQIRLRVTTTTNDQSIIISTTGIIAYRGESVPEAGLTIESAAASSNIVDISLDGTSVSTTATDTKGGVHYRGYCVLSDGTVLYNDIISTTLEQEQQQLSSDSVTHYKIPILLQNMENVFDYTATDTKKGYIKNYYLDNLGGTNSNSAWCISEYIEIYPNVIYKFHIGTNASTSPAVCWYNEEYEFISGNTYGQTYDVSFQSPPDAKYMRMSFYTSTTYPNGEQNTCYVDEITYNIYISNSQLMDEDYIDYETQKVYRNKPNLVTDTIENAAVNSSGKIVTSSIHSAITPITINNVYTIVYARGGTGTSNMLNGFFNQYPAIGSITYNNSRFIFNSSYYTFTAPITGWLVSSYGTDGTIPVVYEGNAPRLVPYDPSVSFPLIQTFPGETSINVDTTINPDKIVLLYSGWREIEGKIYTNGEWVDIDN